MTRDQPPPHVTMLRRPMPRPSLLGDTTSTVPHEPAKLFRGPLRRTAPDHERHACIDTCNPICQRTSTRCLAAPTVAFTPAVSRVLHATRPASTEGARSPPDYSSSAFREHFRPQASRRKNRWPASGLRPSQDFGAVYPVKGFRSQKPEMPTNVEPFGPERSSPLSR
jgi:hypothetical protein